MSVGSACGKYRKKTFTANFALKYHSIHAYQSTERTENHWTDLDARPKNGIQYA